MNTYGDISSLHPSLKGLSESSIELPRTARDVLRRFQEPIKKTPEEMDKLAAELRLEFYHSLYGDPSCTQ